MGKSAEQEILEMDHHLVFKPSKSLRKLARDTLIHEKFKTAYLEEYTDQKSFYLVKDDGIYLMNCYEPMADSIISTVDNNHIVYAEGYDPDVEGIWEKTYAISRDDFAVNIDQTEDALIRIIRGGNIDLYLNEDTIIQRA